MRVAYGPANAHMKSRTFTPSKGRPVGGGSAAGGALGVRRGSARTSSVCSPSGGGRPSTCSGLPDILAIEPGNFTPSTSSQYWHHLTEQERHCHLAVEAPGDGPTPSCPRGLDPVTRRERRRWHPGITPVFSWPARPQ